MLNNQKGFTLIEMLIVLAVISLLLILFIPNLAEKKVARFRIKVVMLY